MGGLHLTTQDAQAEADSLHLSRVALDTVLTNETQTGIYSSQECFCFPHIRKGIARPHRSPFSSSVK